MLIYIIEPYNSLDSLISNMDIYQAENTIKSKPSLYNGFPKSGSSEYNLNSDRKRHDKPGIINRLELQKE